MMSPIARTTLAVVCLSVLLTGCRSAWEAYDEIEIGKPVPGDAILRVSGGKGDFEWQWAEADVVAIPVIGAQGWTRVLEDARGNVVAKEYNGVALGHWLVAQTAAWRWVVEFRVPEYAWRDPPRNWKPPTLDEWSSRRERATRLAAILDPLPDEGHDPFRTLVLGGDVRNSLTGGVCYDTHAVSIHRRRVGRRVLDLIDGGRKSRSRPGRRPIPARS